MQYIDRLSSIAYQKSFLTGIPGLRVVVIVRYLPSQQMWSMDVQFDDFVLNGITVVNSPNLLRGYQNIIPFGLMCTTPDWQDPYRLDDFETGYAKLYLMNEDEVELVELQVYS